MAFIDAGVAAPRPRRSTLARIGTLVSTWYSRVEQRRQLAQFDARMLRDIGLTEAEARRECAKGFWEQ